MDDFSIDFFKKQCKNKNTERATSTWVKKYVSWPADERDMEKMDPVALNKTPVQSNNPTSSTSNSVNENVIHDSMQIHPIINFNNCTFNFGVGSSSVMATNELALVPMKAHKNSKLLSNDRDAYLLE